jgi:hypothetical protein
MSSVDSLPAARGPWEASFQDVSRRSECRFTCTRRGEVRAIRAQDSWGHEFYALLDRNEKCLAIRGTGFLPMHGAAMRRHHAREECKEPTAWVLGVWQGN